MNKKEVIVPANDLVCLGKDKLQELIRCKDCKSWRKSYFESVDGMVCNKTRYIMKPDDYCSMAKRKEE